MAARRFENLRLRSEDVAEFDYRPSACRKAYRMVVVRKNITNDRASAASDVVFTANDRCDQENLLAQLHRGVRALKAPSDSLESNWAYLVMAALAWSLKAWWALSLPPATGRWREARQAEKDWVLGLEFRTFVNALVRLPCPVVQSGGKLVYRLLSWNPHLGTFFRLVGALRC